MEPGDDPLKDMYENFCLGTVTEPIERPKVAIFLMSAFKIGFANANLPAWWHRLLPPNAQLRLGEDQGSADEDDSSLATSGRGLSNAARQRARLDRDNASFWSQARPMFQAFMPAAEPERAASASVVTPAICVQLLQAVPNNSANSAAEQNVRERALNWMANVFDEDARMRAQPPAVARAARDDYPQPAANRRRTE
jgi:hypothetical protein